MMRVHLIGHRPGDDAATTLALAAAAALNGLGADGRRLLDMDHLPSVAEVAREATLKRDTARGALGGLAAEGAVTFKGGGDGRSLLVQVNPNALRDRWANFRQRCRLPVQLRLLHLRPNVLLVSGLILGQRAANGVCEIGICYLVERTGLARRTLERALAAAVASGALKRWRMPNGTKWPRLAVAEGPKLRPSDTHPPTTGRFDESLAPSPSDTHAPLAGRLLLEPGRLRSKARSNLPGSGGRTCPQMAVNLPPGGGQTCPQAADEFRNPPDIRIQPGAEPAPPVVETGPALQKENPTGSATVHRLQLVTAAKLPPKPTTPEQIRAVVESWRIEHKRLGMLSPTDGMHAVAVVLLLERLGWNQPADLHEGSATRRDARTSALRQALLMDARAMIRWANATDTLCTWILRAVADHGPDNLCAYLRKASSAGDPGTLLHGAKKNTAGRAAETWRDYSRATEKALDGEHKTNVEKLLAGTAVVVAEIDFEERTRLRNELINLLALNRHDGARRVLLKLVGSSPRDQDLELAVAGILTLEQARSLIA